MMKKSVASTSKQVKTEKPKKVVDPSSDSSSEEEVVQSKTQQKANLKQ